MKHDVIVLDNNGEAGAFSYTQNRLKPTGGTEVHLTQLCEGLASYGLHVAGISGIKAPEQRFNQGYPHYWPSDWPHRPTEARVIITAGLNGGIPDGYKADRHLVLWTHDPAPNIPHIGHLRFSDIVCVSKWQAVRFPRGWRRAVIPPMIDEWIYDLPKLDKDPNKYVCVSAFWKGTPQTLQLWEQLAPPGATLYVGSPYSHPPHLREMVERTKQCKYITLENPGAVVHALRDAAGTFRVCVAPETFGVTDAIAQVLECRTHVYCPTDLGGLPEALTPTRWVTSDLGQFESEFRKAHRVMWPIKARDLRPKTIMPQWLKVLDL